VRPPPFTMGPYWEESGGLGSRISDALLLGHTARCLGRTTAAAAGGGWPAVAGGGG
jgi:hypothetical protein